jgi:two-component system, cell cycle sensor histidine kinase and response regulator CckA
MRNVIASPARPDQSADPVCRELAFEACPESLAIISDGRVTDCNSAFARLFGYLSTQELRDKPLGHLLPPEHRCTEIARPAKGALPKSCGYPGCVFVGRRKDGTPRRMEAFCREFQCEGKRFLILSTRDVTDRERRRLARDTEARFRTIFRAASIGIYQCTMDGRIVESNPALQKLLGYTEAELRGTDFRSHLHPEDSKAHQDQYADLLCGGREAYEAETRFQMRNGNIGWQLLRLSLLRGPDGRAAFLLGLAEDLTARRAAEQALRNSQKMEAIGRLVAGVSHDFNNLLTAISLYSGLIASSIDQNSAAARYMGELRFATQQGSTLIQQLLTVSRQHPVDPQVLNVSTVVEEMREMLARLAGENICLRTEHHSEGQIRIDRGHLQQVLLNLVLNARDAMADGGCITIETQDVTMRSDEPGRPQPGVALRVRDDGHGMDEATLAHIFEPFFTTKAEARGNGLGLATVYEIVKECKGTISVESSPGKGARFEIVFPCAQSDTSAPATCAQARAAGGDETILLVEDNNLIRASVSELLRSAGYHVFEAATGEQAVAIARKQHDIDLLLTDLAMPGITGLQLATKLRQFRPGLPVICSSGYEPHSTSAAWEEQSVAFLRKPFSPHELVQKVRQVLDTNLSLSYMAGKR